MDDLMRVGIAARYCGVTPWTLRRWENAGRVTAIRVGTRKHRRFLRHDLDVLMGQSGGMPAARREALYVRVSGRGDQLSSLTHQETELRATARGEVIQVFSDSGSGLSENRPGLLRLLRGCADGKVTVVRVTHADRLTRFGVRYLELVLQASGVTLEVLHPEHGGAAEEELLHDFMALLASFAGRLYGQRSAQARARLLEMAKARSS
jgi:putative resolvase